MLANFKLALKSLPGSGVVTACKNVYCTAVYALRKTLQFTPTNQICIEFSV